MLLSDAILHAKRHWRGMRKAPTLCGWADHFGRAFQGYTLDQISRNELLLYVDAQPEGLTPATIYGKVSCISTIFEQAIKQGWEGKKPTMPYPHVPRPLKWWLSPQQHKELDTWLRHQMEGSPRILTTFCTKDLPMNYSSGCGSPTPTLGDLRDYVNWATLTGLRVEETLRVTRQNFSVTPNSLPILTIPGTKTSGSQATVPLSKDAWALASRRLEATAADMLFPMTYRQLYRLWSKAVSEMGWPAGSLKALRRSYARERASKGCPLPQLQQLMRHASPATTMDYLRLTGGQFSNEELAQWL